MDLKMTNAATYVNGYDEVIAALNELGLDGLKEAYGIKNSRNPEYPTLYVLNYDQIESSKVKSHPIVRQCRSLVVELVDCTWRIVSRSFDRFFNYGECGNDADVDVTELVAYEKADGSLVSVFFYNGQWMYRTKSMIMPAEDMTMTSGRSWKELIESTIDGPFTYHDHTYIFEVVSRDNRVVTRYDRDQAYLLNVRSNITGDYLPYSAVVTIANRFYKDTLVPKMYEFNSIEKCLSASKELPNLEEGYVMCNADNNVPVMKIKSPAYVAAHRLRGESALTPKRIIEMIMTGESDEYLSIFPEDSEAFGEVETRLIGMTGDIYSFWYSALCNIEDQKEFALIVMNQCKQYQGFMFTKKQNPVKSFEEMIRKVSTNQLLVLLGYK